MTSFYPGRTSDKSSQRKSDDFWSVRFFFFVALLWILFAILPHLNHIFVNAASPSGNYAPGRVRCPSENLVRIADRLSRSEKAYMKQRRQKEIHSNLVEFFRRIDIPGFDYQKFFRASHGPAHKPTLGIGMAVSGGGFRSMLIGAGGLSAMDLREEGTDQPGHLGGLLQSMSYVTGLSGGAWLIGSLFMNRMPKVSEVISKKSSWNLEFNPLIGEKIDDNFRSIFEHNVLEDLASIVGKDMATLTRQRKLLLSNDFIVQAINSSQINTVYSPYSTLMPRNNSDIYAHGMKTHRIKNMRIPVEQIRKYYESLYEEIQPKKQAGFNISITDFWGRALANVFLGETYWPEMSWSDVIYTPEFQAFKMPYPILTSNALIPKTIPDANTSTIVEMSPYEFGSWSPTLGAFTETRYLGTPMNVGKVVGSGNLKCVQGFDNGAFILASSSSLFNDLVVMGMKHLDGFPHIRSILTKYKRLMGIIGLDGKSNIKKNMDYALYSPNPFYGFHDGVSLPSPAELTNGALSIDHLVHIKEHGNAYTNSPTLHIVDGGEDDLNIPLDPLLQPRRKMDLIIAVDASIDGGSHPNGTSIHRATWRYHGKEHIHGISYPNIPDPKKLVEMKIYSKPHFFGCDLDSAYPNSEMFGGSQSLDEFPNPSLPKPPLILYMPNHEVSFDSQQPTTRLIYDSDDVAAMVMNGYNMFTQSNSTIWSACVGCAMIHREVIRRGEQFPEYCKLCFTTYCVN